MAIATPKNPILYILMRTDLESLNPGKAMAQACHAANYAVETLTKHSSSASSVLYSAWANETTQAFGTTIVLDGGSMNDISSIVNEIEAKCGLTHDMVCYGIVHDPTYPVRDGDVTHLIPLNTCAFVFCYSDEAAAKVLSRLDLHP